jgi:hypothetical protein
MSLTTLAGGSLLGGGGGGKDKHLVRGVFSRHVEKKDKTPKPPTVDEARVQRQETDRIRRRRGTLANIQAGDAAAPTVGTKVLLGG